MRYGNHRVDSYELENPHDERLLEAKRAVEALDQAEWRPEPGEEPLDFRRRVEQHYDLWNEHDSARLDQAERAVAHDVWIDIQSAALLGHRNEANLSQRDSNLRSGGLFDAAKEAQNFKREAREGKNPDLNEMIEDLTQRQAARQEYIANHVVGPALAAKIKQLGLEQVREPEPDPEPPRESPENARHIPSDLMEAASNRQAVKADVTRRMEDLRRERER